MIRRVTHTTLSKSQEMRVRGLGFQTTSSLSHQKRRRHSAGSGSAFITPVVEDAHDFLSPEDFVVFEMLYDALASVHDVYPLARGHSRTLMTEFGAMLCICKER